MTMRLALARARVKCCGLGHDQAAVFLMPSANWTPANTTATSVEPFNARQVFDALSISLNTIVKHATREPEPFVLRCRKRTVVPARRN